MKKQYVELRISVFRDEKPVFVSKVKFFNEKSWFAVACWVYLLTCYRSVARGSFGIDYLLLNIDYWRAANSQFVKKKIVIIQFLWGQQYHGVADSSLRRGQIGPRQDGLRDFRLIIDSVRRRRIPSNRCRIPPEDGGSLTLTSILTIGYWRGKQNSQ